MNNVYKAGERILEEARVSLDAGGLVVHHHALACEGLVVSHRAVGGQWLRPWHAGDT